MEKLLRVPASKTAPLAVVFAAASLVSGRPAAAQNPAAAWDSGLTQAVELRKEVARSQDLMRERHKGGLRAAGLDEIPEARRAAAELLLTEVRKSILALLKEEDGLGRGWYEEDLSVDPRTLDYSFVVRHHVRSLIKQTDVGGWRYLLSRETVYLREYDELVTTHSFKGGLRSPKLWETREMSESRSTSTSRERAPRGSVPIDEH